MKSINLSAYKIYWVEFTAEKGKVLKSDIEKISGRKFDDAMPNGKYYKHFSSKESAIEFLTTFNKTLRKKYSCRLFTDKQLALATTPWNIPFTEKQLNEVYYI